MSVAELMTVVPPPKNPVGIGPPERWAEVEQALGLTLPTDYCEFALTYGSGAFDNPGRMIVTVLNPFAAGYLAELERECDALRADRQDLPREPYVPFGVYPHRPGWLPWGSDIDGNLLCWLTDGDSSAWPLVLLSTERTSFQQLTLSMTTFLARAFCRRVQTFIWHDAAHFADPRAVRFVTAGEAYRGTCGN